MTLRLLIADDHELVREGLRAVFAHTRIEIVGEATTCAEAIQLAEAGDADVLLLDISMPRGDMPGADGFEVLRHVHAATSLAVVMYSMHDRDHCIRRARELGASGYVTKQASSEQLVDAIEAASRGESLWGSRSRKGPDWDWPSRKESSSLMADGSRWATTETQERNSLSRCRGNSSQQSNKKD